MHELLSNNSLFVGQLYEDKSLALHAHDLIFFTTDWSTSDLSSPTDKQWIIIQQFTARADLFLKSEWQLFHLSQG